jgi:signal-transduction protein with cAMP-binding, CBS, and nucleotidyltransferase domain
VSRQSVAGSGFALGRVKILEGVARERLERLSQDCAWYRYGKGTQIIAQQDGGREVYFIASGAVRVRA